MAALKASRTAQYSLLATFSFTIGDTMTNASGNADEFATAAAHAFDVIPLPVGATVVGGEVVTDTAFTGSTAYNVIVGDSGSTNRYLTTTDKTSAGRTALVPTGYIGTGENIRLTVTPTVATATAGKITLRVNYVVADRANEVQIT
jgi:hypothetical protein